MLIVGLTGNYGMGKSVVLGMFKELGAITLDADDVVDNLLHDKAVLEKIRAKFGDSVFSNKGGPDRQKIASLIFRDKEKRDALEGILHPLVFKRISAFLDTLSKEKTKDKVVIVEIPLLFEKGCEGRFQKTITVFTDEHTALERLAKSGVRREDAIMILNAQMPIKEKIRLADLSIDNSGTLEETETRVRDVYKRLKEGLRGMSK